jgi:nicotinamidase-related amidase
VTYKIEAKPYAFEFDPERTALLMIDMQRDFMEPGGLGEFLGNDVSPMRAAVEPARRVLEAAREAGVFVVHTREGHRPDLADLPDSKYLRGNLNIKIGDEGPMGRVLVRGEKGHDIIPEVYPIEGEPVVDKPGKGAFWATDLHGILQNRNITSLIVCGVTLEVCVHTTVREGNDRGYDALVVSDATASYFPEFYRVGLEMISAQGGIFGWVASSDAVVPALEQAAAGRAGKSSAPQTAEPTPSTVGAGGAAR